MTATLYMTAKPIDPEQGVLLVVDPFCDAYWEGYAELVTRIGIDGDQSCYVQAVPTATIGAYVPTTDVFGHFATGDAYILRTLRKGRDGASDARYLRERLASGLRPCVVAAFTEQGEWV